MRPLEHVFKGFFIYNGWCSIEMQGWVYKQKTFGILKVNEPKTMFLIYDGLLYSLINNPFDKITENDVI